MALLERGAMTLEPHVAKVCDRLQPQLHHARADAGAGGIAKTVEELEPVAFALGGLTTPVGCR